MSSNLPKSHSSYMSALINIVHEINEPILERFSLETFT